MNRVLFALLLGFATSALAMPPKAEESDYLRTTGAGFMLEAGAPFYALTFEILQPLPDEVRFEFRFENPAAKREPLTQTAKLEINDDSVVVESVPLPCIRNNRKYIVVVEIYSGPDADEPVAKHTQKVEFRLPRAIIDQLGVTIC